MAKRYSVAKRMEENLANVGVPPQGNHASPQDNKVPPQEQALVISSPMSYGEIRSTFLTLLQL